jgi:hypothetical protein
MKYAATSFAALIALSFCAPTARAWSNKEHIQLTRLAAGRLVASAETPEALKAFLRQAQPDLAQWDLAAERNYFLNKRIGMYPRGVDGLEFWATVPDSDAASPGRKVEPFGVVERSLHFIDLEYFMKDEKRRAYADDLSNRPPLADIPRDVKAWQWERAGMLPFRVEQCYGELVKTIRAGRLIDERGKFPADEHATKWAGFLAHYAADNTQPQHATVDYKSQSYFRNPKSAPNVHADVEYRLIDDESADYPEIRQRMWDELVRALGEVEDPATTPDPWTSTLEVSHYSYEYLPLIGKAALAAYGPDGDRPFDGAAFAATAGTVHGREVTISQMKASQLALAVKRIERLWLQAWAEASRS